MTLPDGSVGNTQISMGQMRTEFSLSGQVSMSDFIVVVVKFLLPQRQQ